MAAPIISNTVVKLLNNRISVKGNYSFAGAPSSLDLTYYLVNEDGDEFGPFNASLTSSTDFEVSPIVGEGKWKIRVILTPMNDTDTIATYEGSEFVSIAKGIFRTLLPDEGGAPGESSLDPAAALNSDMQLRYTASIIGSDSGDRRSSAASALSLNLTSSPILRIFRNTEEIVRVKYSSALIQEVNSNSDVILKTPEPDDVIIFKNADLNTGIWRFALQGYHEGSLKEISGTVGPINSDKQMILSEAPAVGMGFSSEFSFIIPQSVEEL